MGIVPDAMVVMDRELSIVLANELAASLVASKVEEMEGHSFEGLIPERFRAEYAGIVAGYFDDPESVPQPFDRPTRWVLDRDGNEIPVQFSIRSWAENGSEYLILTVRDLSHQHRVQQELLKSEERFRLTANHAADYFAEINVEENSIEIFGDLSGALGYTAEELPTNLGEWLEKIHPDDHDRVLTEVGRIVESGDSHISLDYRYRAADGSYRFFEERGTVTGWLENGYSNTAVAAIRDVTEKVQAQEDIDQMLEELRESERRFRIAAGHAVDILQTVDAEQDLVVHHGDVDALMGYPPGGFPSTLTGWIDLMHPDDRDRIQVELDQAIAAGVETWRFEYRILAGDGSYRHWLDCGTVTAYLEDGSAHTGIGAIQDITEQVEARQKLESALIEVRALKDRLAAESVYLQEEIRTNLGSRQIVGQCDVWMRVLEQVRLVAGSDSTVLLHGETGTGKEVIARAVHSASTRGDRPLIKVNCAALPNTLIESELFGHEKGAFTGADAARDGRFVLADGGTIFLDEISELPLGLQAKLLQVLEDGTFEPLGSSKTRQVDVRVLAATNRNLEAAVRAGDFRSDLYYRLAVFPIELPPLRDRRDDVPYLATYFLGQYRTTKGLPFGPISESTIAVLQGYDWPGNVRELKNVIERAVIVSPGDALSIDPAALRSPRDRRASDRGEPGSSPTTAEAHSLRNGAGGTLEEMERAHIIEVLEASAWKVKGRGNAAERLGLKESTLRSRMKKLGIQRPGSDRGPATA